MKPFRVFVASSTEGEPIALELSPIGRAVGKFRTPPVYLELQSLRGQGSGSILPGS